MERQEPAGSTKSACQARNGLVILLLAGVLFSIVSVHYVIPPVLPAIARTFDVSISRAAFLVSIYALSYACFSLLLGPSVDRFERKVIMCSALLAFAATTFLCGIAQDFQWLLIFRAAAGLAAAILQSTTWAYLVDYFPHDKRGTAAAWTLQAGALALIMGVPLGGLITQFLSWRWIFFLAALLGSAIAVAIGAKLPSCGTHTRAELHNCKGPLSTKRPTLGSLIARGPARSALLVCFLTWFGFYGLYTYLGAFLRQQFGLNSAQTGFMTLSVGLGYTLGSQLGGRLSDRLGRRRVILAGLGWLALVLAIVPNVRHLPFAIAGIFAMGCGFFFIHSAQVPLISELIPRARATAMSMNYFFAHVGMMAGSASGGLVLAWSGLPSVGLMSAVACVLAAVVAQRATLWTNLSR